MFYNGKFRREALARSDTLKFLHFDQTIYSAEISIQNTIFNM